VSIAGISLVFSRGKLIEKATALLPVYFLFLLMFQAATGSMEFFPQRYLFSTVFLLIPIVAYPIGLLLERSKKDLFVFMLALLGVFLTLRLSAPPSAYAVTVPLTAREPLRNLSSFLQHTQMTNDTYTIVYASDQLDWFYPLVESLTQNYSLVNTTSDHLNEFFTYDVIITKKSPLTLQTMRNTSDYQVVYDESPYIVYKKIPASQNN